MPENSDRQSTLHALMVAFVRTTVTAEASHQAGHGAYVSWQALLENPEQQQYLNDWLARFYPEFYPNVANMHFANAPEVLPGLKLRLIVAPDGQSYVLVVEDATDKSGFALVSDERGMMRECKYVQ